MRVCQLFLASQQHARPQGCAGCRATRKQPAVAKPHFHNVIVFIRCTARLEPVLSIRKSVACCTATADIASSRQDAGLWSPCMAVPSSLVLGKQSRISRHVLGRFCYGCDSVLSSETGCSCRMHASKAVRERTPQQSASNCDMRL